MSDVREVPAEAHLVARQAFEEATGMRVGLYAYPLIMAVQAAAKPIQDAMLRRFTEVRQGCAMMLIAAVSLAFELAVYVAVALGGSALMRVLAVASIVVRLTLVVYMKMFERRARRRAQALLDSIATADIP